MRLRQIILGFSLSFPMAVPAMGQGQTMLVFDASGSMWGQISGETKIAIARRTVTDLLGDLPTDRHLGLTAYGHRRKGDCSDIEVLVNAGPDQGSVIATAVTGLTPKGKTPMTDAVTLAAEQMRYTEDAATVVLISDGVETCAPDPCGAARVLEETGVNFTAHVIGFDITDPEADAQLACIAAETGGQYISASNAQDLAAALTHVVAADPVVEEVVEKPVEPELPAVTLAADDAANIGSKTTVAWDGIDVGSGGYEILVRRTDGSHKINSIVLRSNDPTDLEMPTDPGTYEIALQQISKQRIIATRLIEVRALAVSVVAPEQVFAGSKLSVDWIGPGYRTDRIGIGFDGQRPKSNTMLGDNATSPTEVFVPVTPGSYVITYYLSQDHEVLAQRPVEVVLPDASLSAPASAVAGTTIAVDVTGPLYRNDMIGIVALGESGKSKGRHSYRLSKGLPAKLVLPDAPGTYEIHYFLANKNARIATTEITIEPTESQ